MQPSRTIRVGVPAADFRNGSNVGWTGTMIPAGVVRTSFGFFLGMLLYKSFNSMKRPRIVLHPSIILALTIAILILPVSNLPARSVIGTMTLALIPVLSGWDYRRTTQLSDEEFSSGWVGYRMASTRYIFRFIVLSFLRLPVHRSNTTYRKRRCSWLVCWG
jgi:hypothetical protein